MENPWAGYTDRWLSIYCCLAAYVRGCVQAPLNYFCESGIMQIQVNGQEHSTEENISLQDLLNRLGYQNRKIAVELNELIVPSRLYAETKLQENDSLEIVQAIGGG